MATISDISRTVGQRVKELRGPRGVRSQAALAQSLTEEGVETSRDVIANLELGRRERITVEELFAIAIVLNVAPVDLLVPPDAGAMDEYHVTPSTTARPGQVRDWLAGEPAIAADAGTARDFMAAAPRDRWAAWLTRRHPAMKAIAHLQAEVQDAIQLEDGVADGETVWGGTLDGTPDELERALTEVEQNVQALRSALDRRRREREDEAVRESADRVTRALGTAPEDDR